MATATDEPVSGAAIDEAREAFELAVEAENDNREKALDDLRFARLGDQWPAHIRQAREQDHRPCLTINRMPAFIRQVVNDARQNKPAIKVHPADSEADPATAEIINGLIRNIEYTSDADVAYDTATECAVSMGWGYLKVDLDYAYDDTFDLDIEINRVSNPFSIYGDPHSTAADSCDWNTAFETEWLTRDAFEQQFPDADVSDWDGYSQVDKREQWFRDDEVMIAKWWRREEVSKTIVLLSDGRVLPEEHFLRIRDLLELEGVTAANSREALSYKVTRHLLSGREVLKSEPWPGCYIPIIPVYGDEVDEEGKRHFRSLVRDAKDAQRQYNYWRTTATELVALAPRVPFIGPKGAFKTDANRWATANTVSHPYLEYDGPVAPQRQPLDTGAAGGALQEALNASDDMKAIMGLYDASLGAQSNDISGRAILARQREGDVATFHFQDNMARAIRHTGRILIDLIPKVYDAERIIRILGEDGTPDTIPLKKPVPVTDQQGQPVMEPVKDQMGRPVVDPATGQPRMQPKTRIYDLALGKYDLTVTTGPSYTTRREEAAVQMTEMVRAFPPAFQLAGDLIAKNLDWPGADEIAKRMKAMLPPQASGGLPPQVQQMIEQAKMQIGELQERLKKAEGDRSIDQAKIQVDAYEAQTDRLKMIAELSTRGVDAGFEAPDPLDRAAAAAKIERDEAAAQKDRATAMSTRVRALREATAPVVRHDPDPHYHRQFSGD